MTRKKRAQNQRAAKDARTKKVAIGLSVVLVAVLAFEVPKLMHSGSSSSTPPAATTTTDSSTAATGAPVTAAPGTTAAASVSVSATSTKVPNSDVAPQASKGQLDSFTHFTGKDPFVQQVSDASSTSTSSSSSQSGSGTLSANVSGSSASSAGSGNAQHPSRTLAATGAARISVNGRVQVVRVGASFPSANPLFRLVGLVHGGVRIGITNGSYSSGAQTVSLTPGRTVTLVDTADGVRYKIRLLSAS